MTTSTVFVGGAEDHPAPNLRIVTVDTMYILSNVLAPSRLNLNVMHI